MSSFEEKSEQELYIRLMETGFVDKQVFDREIAKFKQRLLKQSDLDLLLLNFAECVYEVGGDPDVLCTYDYLANTPALQLFETIAPNGIVFSVLNKDKD